MADNDEHLEAQRNRNTRQKRRDNLLKLALAGEEVTLIIGNFRQRDALIYVEGEGFYLNSSGNHVPVNSVYRVDSGKRTVELRKYAIQLTRSEAQ